MALVHGTTNAYNNLGCRCDDCKAANAKRQREYKARRRGKFVDSANITHGTEATYQAGCSCANCKYAHAQYGRNRYNRYGLTETAYAEFVAAANGHCTCCNKEAKLVPDHDHATNQLRGMLCTSCNTGIGKLGDTLEGVEKAVAYLKQA